MSQENSEVSSHSVMLYTVLIVSSMCGFPERSYHASTGFPERILEVAKFQNGYGHNITQSSTAHTV